MSDRVLVVLFPGCLMLEIQDALAALRAEYPLDVATAGGRVVKSGDGVQLTGALALEVVDPAAYRCAIVPGGDLFAPLHDGETLRVLTGIAARPGAVVGGICNGAVLLGAAGLLNGRRATHPIRPPHASPEQIETLGPFVEGATFVDSAVVVDDGIVTARPTATAEFARALVLALEAED